MYVQVFPVRSRHIGYLIRLSSGLDRIVTPQLEARISHQRVHACDFKRLYKMTATRAMLASTVGQYCGSATRDRHPTLTHPEN